ncbi:2-amino-4-hydroxy-6-hydroxymethyldihydropteridine diphosphokinase [Pelodictyon luteolum]|uniref:2-amino-4-hydroxy-6-hydroxymethyldihydropteridine pyrophosphokinase n=1 Tax=Chlorobium luteolum (strain DSM 273 / BCRC 81028 / 2530) TaxID=319225 RepID=Q3B675_CHLL3|nr:2-amino-4-hydroxy-6-hydroxymethyldihydropteridine diphosphokinase [Pelodictyon luteolum]ABB23156.1 7,8-Dihydro-6-hydroxymethylpterin-pyrophosphokinase, HPPK [Pelodictyon luteolum DSM 273]
MKLHTAYIGTGSNIGDRLSHLQEAVCRLGALPETKVLRASPVYMTEPVGEEEQERFYNGVVQIETGLTPENLRSATKAIEQELGRPERYRRWSPRVIDLDILLYADCIIETDTLRIPHPELHRRKFVLIPLLDIANPLHPVLRKTILQMLRTCGDRSVPVRLRERLRLH